MAKTEILKELENNLREMERLIKTQKFNVIDAQKYMMRWFNVYRSMEQVTLSRDKWKKKYMELKNEQRV